MTFILFSLAGAALTLSLLFTPVVRALALRWGLVDSPGTRKLHKQPIPRIGGVAISAAYFGSCLIVAALFAYFRPDLPMAFSAIRSIAPATLLIFSIGLADDLLHLKPWQKFAVQVVASCAVISAGVHMGESSLLAQHPVVARVVSVAWLLLCTNAVKLIDGLDGLATGIALLATMTTLLASLMTGSFELAIATAPLAGALTGFLFFNSNPASIFLGDSGSLVLGFLLGCFSLLWSVKSTTLLGATAPLMALSVPLLDITLAVVRRFLRRQPIFLSDRSHVHHRLMALGLTHRRAVYFLYGAGMIAGVLSLSLIWAPSRGETLILLAFVSTALFIVEKLRYPELHAVRKTVLGGGLRREINAQLEIQNLANTLQEAQTAEECWTAVQRNSGDFGFEIVRMRLAGRMFGSAELGTLSSAIRVAITEQDWIDLSLDATTNKHPNILMPFVMTVQHTLADKQLAFRDQHGIVPIPVPFHQVISPTIQ